MTTTLNAIILNRSSALLFFFLIASFSAALRGVRAMFSLRFSRFISYFSLYIRYTSAPSALKFSSKCA